MQIIAAIGIGFSVLALLAGLVLILRWMAQKQTLSAIRARSRLSGMSGVEHLSLGGIEQCILTEATDPDKPLLLFLHGGPGMPVPYGVGFRNRHPRLAESFILVFWDQRGAGKSYNPGIPEESLNLEQFISDTRELIAYLKQKYHQEKVFLAAHSWGTAIALHYVSRFPEDILAYFALEQIVNTDKSDLAAYQWAQDKSARSNLAKVSETLEQIGPPPYPDKSWGKFRQVLMRLGAYTYRAKGVNPPNPLTMLFPAMISPDYTLGDILRLFVGMQFSYKGQMIRDINALAFDLTTPAIQVPVVFFQGIHDHLLCQSILDDYVRLLTAPKGKEVVYLEASGHMYCDADKAIVDQKIIKTSELLVNEPDFGSSGERVRQPSAVAE